jgi:hypothetical protein
MDEMDILEWIKIAIAIVIGYIIIRALLSTGDEHSIRCICDCVNQTIKALPRVYAR